MITELQKLWILYTYRLQLSSFHIATPLQIRFDHSD